MRKILIQQGDCLIRECESIPETAIKVEIVGNSFVVLKGEGVNTHELQSETLSKDIELYQDGDTLYISALADVPIVHQEHGTTIFQKGQIGERVIEREFDYEEMEARNVKD